MKQAMEHIMLAQVDIEWWHIVSGLIILIGGTIIKWYLTVLSERAKERREERRDDEHTTFLKRIADASEKNSSAVTTMSEQLRADRDIQKLMHDQTLAQLPTLCKMNGNGHTQVATRT